MFDSLDLYTNVMLDNGMSIPGIEAFCVMLHRLSYASCLCMMLHLYGRSPVVLSRMVTWMIKLVYLWVQPILHWDHWCLTVRKLHEYAEAVTTNGGDDMQVGEGIFRFIDGTVRLIAQPLFNQEIFYSGWKWIHAIKFQGIMAPDGIMMHISGPYTAKHHDMWILC